MIRLPNSMGRALLWAFRHVTPEQMAAMDNRPARQLEQLYERSTITAAEYKQFLHESGNEIDIYPVVDTVAAVRGQLLSDFSSGLKDMLEALWEATRKGTLPLDVTSRLRKAFFTMSDQMLILTKLQQEFSTCSICGKALQCSELMTRSVGLREAQCLRCHASAGGRIFLPCSAKDCGDLVVLPKEGFKTGVSYYCAAHGPKAKKAPAAVALDEQAPEIVDPTRIFYHVGGGRRVLRDVWVPAEPALPTAMAWENDDLG